MGRREGLRFLVVVVLAAACGSKQPSPRSATAPPPGAKAKLVAAAADEQRPPPHEHGEKKPKGLTLATIAEGAAPMANLGTLQRSITTSSKEAQIYFDQGLRLTFAFNHDEAARSFAKAAQLDPKCASCFWGVALVLGPNYNVPMLADRFPAAWQALQQAQKHAGEATPVEQALIGALGKRYPGAEPLDPEAMGPYNQAYADEMAKVAAAYPADDDVQLLYAESLMDLRPWRLWTHDGKPAPDTELIVKTIETVLARNADHPGANHYYIHAVEPSPKPEKAVKAADRLASLMPGAGHIVHMPSHIYQRVGRYADAAQANRDATAVDLAYIDRAPKWGYYPMYLVHNLGFLSYATSMEGRQTESLDAARESAKNFPPRMLKMMPGMDFFISEPQLVMVRFRRWDDILAEPRPDDDFPTLTGLWLHAHGMANAATGKLDAAAGDLAELKALRDTVGADVKATNNSARDILNTSVAVLEAAVAQTRGDANRHDLWAEAVKLQDAMVYAEPADWFYPVRHFQAAALLEDKKFKQAEAVYRADLKANPENGWALWGLTQALKGQKKTGEARKVEARFKKAWKNADYTLTTTGLREPPAPPAKAAKPARRSARR